MKPTRTPSAPASREDTEAETGAGSEAETTRNGGNGSPSGSPARNGGETVAAARKGAGNGAVAAAGPAPQTEPLALWNRLKRTDPKVTKPFTRPGGFRGTQIDPTWRMQLMTEVFGPIGKGWGYEQLEWTIAERMVFICVRVWYRDPETGETLYTGPQWGGTEMVRRRRDGVEMPDDECFKMSMTDAIGKCLLQLGLGADVYLGQFDDSKYREESEAYYNARSNPELQPDAIASFEAEVREKLAAVAGLDGLDALWRSGVSARVREIGLIDKDAQRRIVARFAETKAELLKRQDAERAKEDAMAAA